MARHCRAVIVAFADDAVARRGVVRPIRGVADDRISSDSSPITTGFGVDTGGARLDLGGRPRASERATSDTPLEHRGRGSDAHCAVGHPAAIRRVGTPGRGTRNTDPGAGPGRVARACSDHPSRHDPLTQGRRRSGRIPGARVGVRRPISRERSTVSSTGRSPRDAAIR